MNIKTLIKCLLTCVSFGVVTIVNAAHYTQEQVADYLSFDNVRVERARAVLHEGDNTYPFLSALPANEIAFNDDVETERRILRKIPREVFLNPNIDHTVLLNGFDWTVNFKLFDPTLSDLLEASENISENILENMFFGLGAKFNEHVGRNSAETVSKFSNSFVFGTAENDFMAELEISRSERNLSYLNALEALKAIELPVITFGELLNGLFGDNYDDPCIEKDGNVWKIVNSEATVTAYRAYSVNNGYIQETNARGTLDWDSVPRESLAYVNKFKGVIYPMYTFNSENETWNLYVKYVFQLLNPNTGDVLFLPFNLGYTLPAATI